MKRFHPSTPTMHNALFHLSQLLFFPSCAGLIAWIYAKNNHWRIAR